MGDGLKRAILAALWTQSWIVAGEQLLGTEVVKAYHSLPSMEDFLRAIGAKNRTDRRADRALQLLKKKGLIEYKRGTGWIKT